MIGRLMVSCLCLLLFCSGTLHAEERKVLRFTETAPELQKLSPETRTELAHNTAQLPLAELNVSITALNTLEFKNDASAAVPGNELRVVAWNIERGRYWREAADLLKSHPEWKGADVLLISEMDLGMERSGNENTTRELANALGMNYVYGIEFLELWEGGKRNSGVNADHEYGYHGNAILSRFPLKNVRMLRFPGIERWWGSGEHRLGGRNAMLAEIESSNGDITLVSTHLESGFGDNAMRVEEVQMILDELKEHAPGRPVIFGGDLNALPTSDPVRLLRENGFEVDDCNTLKEGTAQGFKKDGIFAKFMRIDYIAVRELQAHSPAVLDAVFEKDGKQVLISDHAAVAVMVKLP